MNIVEVKQAYEKGELPIALNTAYKWNSQKKYPKLLVKVTGKLFFNIDEWQAMAKKALDNQVKEAERVRSLLS